MIIYIDGPAPTAQDAAKRALVVFQRPTDTRPQLGVLIRWPAARAQQPGEPRRRSRGAKATVVIDRHHIGIDTQYVHLVTPAIQSAIAVRIVRQPEGATHGG